MSMKFENMVRCNNCMKVFHENEIIYNEREEKEILIDLVERLLKNND